MAGAHITEEQADEYAIGAMDPEVALIVALHVHACRPCQALVAASERVAASLALGIPLRPTPPKLKRNVLRSAGIIRPGPLRIAARIATASAGLAAVFVAVAAFTGMLSVRGQVSDLRAQNNALQVQINDALAQEVEILALTRQLDEQERVSNELRIAANGDRELLLALLSPDSNVAEVIAVDESVPAIGRLVWDQQQKKVWFVASNLPTRPDGETYQIWLNSGGKYVSIGTFNSDSKGFARYVTFVPQGLTTYESAVVTIERAGSPQRSGTSVFVTDLSGLRQ